MQYNPLADTDIDKVLVKTKDGKTYIAQYDSSRNLIPVRLVDEESPAARYIDQQPQNEPQQQQEPQNGQQQPGQGQQSAQGEPQETDMQRKFREAMEKMAKQYADDANKAAQPGQVIQPQPISAKDYAKKTIESTMHWRTGVDLGKEVHYQTPEKLPVLDDTVFRARLSSIMTDNKFDRVVRGRTRGKLDMTRLFKVQTKSNSVFTQKQERKNKVYNVVLVVDESGSMGHGPIEQAADAALYLAKNFVGLNINLAILGFNHYQVIHKNFNERIEDYDQLKKRMVNRPHGHGGGCTHDYDALARAYKMLVGMDGQSFVILLADGHPGTCSAVSRAMKHKDQYLKDIANPTARSEFRNRDEVMWTDVTQSLDYNGRNDITSFHHLVKANESLADTIGIGIYRDCVQIPHNVTINNLDELKPKVLDAIRKKVKRG